MGGRGVFREMKGEVEGGIGGIRLIAGARRLMEACAWAGLLKTLVFWRLSSRLMVRSSMNWLAGWV